jgi:threonine/homoserine/homoserine lactone efflux protein
MQQLVTLVAIAGAIAIGAASPGPSFVYVSRVTLAGSRAHGYAAAIGMGAGSVAWAVLAMAGLGTLMHYAESAFLAVKMCGGIYLAYLGLKMWRHAGATPDGDAMLSARRPGWQGSAAAALAQLSNPKALIVYGSIFAAMVPSSQPVWMYFAIPVVVMSVETGWYAIVAWGMSSRGPRAAYARWSRTVDRVAGASLTAIGGGFTLDAARTATR